MKTVDIRVFPKVKTAAQMEKENNDKAAALPIEVKKIFWRAMTKEGKNLGEAREIAGIDDCMVAAALVIQLHDTYHLPKSIDSIN